MGVHRFANNTVSWFRVPEDKFTEVSIPGHTDPLSVNAAAQNIRVGQAEYFGGDIDHLMTILA
jgi:hypothetical protein